jgi:hypothetical protein
MLALLTAIGIYLMNVMIGGAHGNGGAVNTLHSNAAQQIAADKD